MKYKRKIQRKITSGALAITLFVGGGSSAYAAHIQGSPTTNTGMPASGLHRARGLGLNHNRAIGEVVAITSTGFTLEVHNSKYHSKASDAAAVMVPFDVKTTNTTVYQKDGAVAKAGDVAIGQKAVVVGTIDPATQIITAEKVNIVTKIPDRGANRMEKGLRKAK